MIMVTGASGALGSLIVNGLNAAGAEVVAGTRAPAPDDLAEGRARTVDFDRPATLAAAFSTVEVLVMVSAGFAEDDVVRARHEAVIDAAEAAGVRHIVYTSLTGAGDLLSIALAHRATERRLAASGPAWTVLRNGLYAELLAPAAAAAAGSGLLDLPMGAGAIALVAREDLADAAVRVALESTASDRHANRAYELVGDKALDGAQIAAAISAAANRPVRYEPTTLAAFRAVLHEAGLLGYPAAHTVSIYSNIAAGYLDSTTSDLAALLPNGPRDAIGIVTAAIEAA